MKQLFFWLVPGSKDRSYSVPLYRDKISDLMRGRRRGFIAHLIKDSGISFYLKVVNAATKKKEIKSKLWTVGGGKK
jgi:hypothetical protein